MTSQPSQQRQIIICHACDQPFTIDPDKVRQTKKQVVYKGEPQPAERYLVKCRHCDAPNEITLAAPHE
jgi:NAD-dependent SIR2 family protein deacetylase